MEIKMKNLGGKKKMGKIFHEILGADVSAFLAQERDRVKKFT